MNLSLNYCSPLPVSTLSTGEFSTKKNYSTSNLNNCDNKNYYRYLTYGTTQQLQQEYVKFLPWQTLTEFRLRRKLRRFKRTAARKFLNVNKLFGKSINRIQNVKNLIKMIKLANNNNEQQQQQTDDNDLNNQISRSSSLTSLLNLIEEANKNLLNSFYEEDMKKKLKNQENNDNDPPKCPPRLKRTQSSFNLMDENKQNNVDINNKMLIKQNTLPSIENYWINNNIINNNKNQLNNNYRIAFVENKTTTDNLLQQQNNKNNELISDTISIKSLDSYFGQINLNDQQQQNEIKKQNKDQDEKNSKILCVRSHFQINNGTVYLEDSDWEMLSQISETISLNEFNNQNNDGNDKNEKDSDMTLIDMALSKMIISNNNNNNNGNDKIDDNDKNEDNDGEKSVIKLKKEEKSGKFCFFI